MSRSTSPAQALRPARLPLIDPGRCTGCGWCLPTCELHLLSLETAEGRKTSVLQGATSCTGCCRCALKCPFGAITMSRTLRVAGAPSP